MHVETEQPHAETAQLHMHVGPCRQGLDPLVPLGEHLVALALVAAEPDRATDMVEHDRRARESARKVDHIGELRVVDPGVEAQPQRSELSETLAYLFVDQQPLRPYGRGAPLRLIRMNRGDEADAAEAA